MQEAPRLWISLATPRRLGGGSTRSLPGRGEAFRLFFEGPSSGDGTGDPMLKERYYEIEEEKQSCTYFVACSCARGKTWARGLPLGTRRKALLAERRCAMESADQPCS